MVSAVLLICLAVNGLCLPTSAAESPLVSQETTKFCYIPMPVLRTRCGSSRVALNTYRSHLNDSQLQPQPTFIINNLASEAPEARGHPGCVSIHFLKPTVFNAKKIFKVNDDMALYRKSHC